ncbi:MAG: cation diffusion facilitator family transporter [Betaproteobacteria bacterium]|nr:cation diffusion facilitator family transporter [Betaproteobacteria bacterium]
MMDHHAGDHGHSHCHDHGHGPNSFRRAFAVGIALNVAFVLAEVAYGLKAHSLALLSDAGHNLSDVLSLLLSWGAITLSQRQPSSRFTYGLRSSTILAALFNAVLLLAAMGWIAWEAMQRFVNPVAVEGGVVAGVAVLGVVINTATALLFMAGRKHDLNIRAAFLHMAADAAISFGVVLTGIGILFSGWFWLDPVVSLVLVGVVVLGTWGLLRDSLNLALHAVPAGVEPSAVWSYLASLPGVAQVHDLHIWGMSTTESALTVHLVMPSGYPGDAFICEIARNLHNRFHIGHPTIQVETGDPDYPCVLEPNHVV